MKQKSKILISLLLLFGVDSASAETLSDTPRVSLGGFLDTYYVSEQEDPGTRPRNYTTQSLYQEEPYVNLLSAEVSIESDSALLKFVPQWGSSVTSNYAAEPSDAWKYVQEAYVRLKLSDTLSFDTGIFLSHIGSEGWLSKDNLTYSRSFIAEYSPYYESGFRLNKQFSDTLNGQLLLIRGWQNISDGKNVALGTLLTQKLGSDFSLTHTSFLGNENGARIFNDFYLRWTPSDSFETLATYDVGYQRQHNEISPDDSAWWSGFAVISRYQMTKKVSLSLRLERFSDPEGVVAVPANEASRFSVNGASVNLDYLPLENLLLRVEYRPLYASKNIFPEREGSSDNSQALFLSASTWLSPQKLF